MQETSNTYLNNPQKGLVTDLQENLVNAELWTHARNAKLNSHIGQIRFLQNEPSPIHCITFPYTPIGFIKLLNNKWAVFLADDSTNSEIGIFDEHNCTYTKVVNAQCLNFNTRYLISGYSKENFDCTETIYWTDGFNERRTLNLGNFPRTYTIKDDACETKEYTQDLDCSEIVVDKPISIPKISLREGSSGALKNGTYQVAIAYAENNVRITEVVNVSNPQAIWSHVNSGKSISVKIDNLDRDFDQYELIVIYSKDEAVFYKSLGFYSTAIDTQSIYSVDRQEYTPLALIDVLAKRPRYSTADLIVANDTYLLWAGLKTTTELNYQKQALNIKTKYVVYQAPSNYYANGGNKVGYERDEVYSFAIQWLYANGEWSSAFHIPGRKANGEKVLASGKDVYELNDKTDDEEIVEKIEKWQVENTAGKMKSENRNNSKSEKVIGSGEMAYWESSVKYPDNVEQFGELACTNILHHKMPDNITTHIYQPGGKYINILGVKFENIEHPKDKDGKYLNNIVGYRIVRGDRGGNNSIVAKGIITNVRASQENGEEVLYANYPYNDLRPDNFISKTQTYLKSSERGFVPVADYKQDAFNFYSPMTLFSNVSLGNELKVLTEENGTVVSKFEKVYKQPQFKLLTQFDLYFALIIGALDGYYATTGRKCTTVIKDQKFTLGPIDTPSGPTAPNQINKVNAVQESACDDALKFTSSTSVDKKKIKAAERILRSLAKAGIFAYFTLDTANKVLDIIRNYSPWQEYALQCNSELTFASYKPAEKDNKRRRIDYYQYLYDGLNTVEDTVFNNYKRENSVYLKLNDILNDPSTEDNSRNTLTQANKLNDIFSKFNSTASAYYVAVKRKMADQYGNIETIKYLDTGYLETNLKQVNQNSTKKIYKSDVVFGGDTFINKMSILRKHHYFSQYIIDVPNGFIYDYRPFRNVGYPRYWIDSTTYDLSDFVSLRPKQSNTPRNKFNLEGTGKSNGLTVIKDKYFYLFNAGAMEFFTESPFNLDYRDWKESSPNFYSSFNKDVSSLFRSDNIEKREEFVYDKTFSKQLTENVIFQQSSLYNPEIEETCYKYLKNRVIYSQPNNNANQKLDAWKIYLANNFYDFASAQFGDLTAMHPIDNQQIMFLFDKASPYITIGRDELQLDGSGKKIVLGDNGLFTRDPRPIIHTDFNYGNCQSKWSFTNTHYGSFYPSQRQGRIFNYTGKLEDISKAGMYFWLKNNLPSKLLEDFPGYPNNDNPVSGVGVTSIFDSTDETYYISKKDWALKPEYKGLVRYDSVKNKFYKGITPFKLGDPVYFDNASWTLSYNPEGRFFISWHDWHPDWMLQTEKHFVTVKDKAIWKHNVNTKSFNNFYGIDYPFEIEFVVNNGQNVEILRSIEYFLEVGMYMNQGYDFHMLLDENFDEMIISNNEQISGVLKPHIQSKNDMSTLLDYPRIDLPNKVIHITYNKEEQKYRTNMFWDITKDRGEFTGNSYPLWITESNGYIKNINDKAVDYTKTDILRKKFRNNYHKVLLRKVKSGNKKMIFKFNNSKQLISFT